MRSAQFGNHPDLMDSSDMGKLKRCFITLQCEQLGSITIVFKLFSRTLPHTVGNFIKLCRGEYGELNCSYKRSIVTRVIAPEYIVQMGRIVKRSDRTMSMFKGIVDEKETHPITFKKSGYICLVGGNSPEIFITLTRLSKFKELDGYKAIGMVEQPSLEELNNWLKKVNVDKADRPIAKIWISRCGELVEKSTGV